MNLTTKHNLTWS